ncbi:MAG: ATP-binding cassette domain-containing protein [Blautia sp.]|jgi:ABC-2 type transport system ATP-binding protein
MIEVNNLVKRYKELVALDHFHLQVKKGEIFSLLGPNGSGKTTAINCMLSLLKYDKGEIRLFGEPMRPDNYSIKQRLGVVPQNVAVFNELNVYENIDYFCGLYISDKKKRRALVEEAIAFTGLEDFQKFLPKKLSGGLLRRLNIACGIAHKPALIFMDEPTVAVDPQSRNNILEGIRRLNAEGATIVYTSHYMEEVEQICTRIMIMDKGQEIATGTKEDLKSMIRSGEKLTIELNELPGEIFSKLQQIPGVLKISFDNHLVNARLESGSHALVDILDTLRRQNLTFGRVFTEPPTLNDVFLEITGKELRD